MKRKFLIILIAIVCAVYCAVMFSACAVKEKVDDTVNNSSVTDQTNDSNGDGNGENSETPETPENPESGDEDNDKPTAPGTTEGDGQGDTGETVEPDTPETGNTPNTGDAEEKQDEYIYTKEDGWNTQLLAKTLEDWMIENDYLKVLTGHDSEIKRFLFIETKNDNVISTALCRLDDKTIIQNFAFRPKFFDEMTKDSVKKEDFINILDNTLKDDTKKQVLRDSSFEFEYSTLDKDYDTHREEFETLTNSVISRLSEIGVQDDAKAVGVVNDIFKNSQRIYGFKTHASSQYAGAWLGNMRSWNQYYLIKKDNKYQFVDVGIGSSIDGEIFGYGVDEKQYVLENATGKNWIVSHVKSKEVLFVDNSK